MRVADEAHAGEREEIGMEQCLDRWASPGAIEARRHHAIADGVIRKPLFVQHRQHRRAAHVNEALRSDTVERSSAGLDIERLGIDRGGAIAFAQDRVIIGRIAQPPRERHKLLEGVLVPCHSVIWLLQGFCRLKEGRRFVTPAGAISDRGRRSPPRPSARVGLPLIWIRAACNRSPHAIAGVTRCAASEPVLVTAPATEAGRKLRQQLPESGSGRFAHNRWPNQRKPPPLRGGKSPAAP